MTPARIALLMALPFLEEAAAWEKACADAAKSEEARKLDDTHHWIPLESGGVAHVALSGFGLGTYRWRNLEAEHALAAALAALEQS